PFLPPDTFSPPFLPPFSPAFSPVDSHLLRGCPPKLLLISTGNISNRDLEALATPLIPDIVREFGSHSFLVLSRAGIIIRG
ncbi:MAG TPA: hypothetical protein VMS17_05150, partial [Gemmataceae bacterium]|nr:hypothetical protein [Gemmataceae bacterium]